MNTPLPRPRPAPVAATVCYLHIMKTGGTSLMNSLARRFERRRTGSARLGVFVDELVTWTSDDWAGVAFVAGHLPYEATGLLPEGTRTITVLRDPVERTLSHYWQIRRDPEVLAESPHFCLEEFLTADRWSGLSHNYQARQLAHSITLQDAHTAYDPAQRFAALGPPFPERHPLPLQCLFDCTPFELSPAELYDVAAKHLATIDVVGTTDDLDAVHDAALDLAHLCDPAPVPHDNVGVGRPLRADLDPDVLRHIEARNEVDRALFRLAALPTP